MEKINIAELLKDCPKGMELDCTMFETPVQYIELAEGGTYVITITTSCGKDLYLTKEGYLYNMPDSKCVIFPKGKTTWEGFQRPFKDGDVVYNRFQDTIGIVVYGKDNFLYKICDVSKKGLWYNEGSTIAIVQKDYRLATEEEKQKLFKAIKDNGYRWNADTKTLEKLIKPKFKVGDKVRHKNNHNVIFTITSITEDSYGCGLASAFWFENQDDYELAPNKFDIAALKPFDKVLVRDYDTQEWRISFFGRCNGLGFYKYSCINGCGYAQCIPYKNNEHLLGEKDDCNEYYKTWK